MARWWVKEQDHTEGFATLLKMEHDRKHIGTVQDPAWGEGSAYKQALEISVLPKKVILQDKLEPLHK